MNRRAFLGILPAVGMVGAVAKPKPPYEPGTWTLVAREFQDFYPGQPIHAVWVHASGRLDSFFGDDKPPASKQRFAIGEVRLMHYADEHKFVELWAESYNPRRDGWA